MSKEYRLTTHMHVSAPREVVFSFFSAAENLEKLTPAELGFVIRTALPIPMAPGTLIDYTIRLWRLPIAWQTRIAEWDPPHRFVDEQLRGPYRTWVHTHRFTSAGGGTDIEDDVTYSLPLGVLGRLVAPLIRIQLNRIFRYRQEQVRRIFNPHR